MDNFNSFNIPDYLKNALTSIKLVTPTPIQAKSIPIALEGQDIIGSAQTGTGKTLAFLIPILSKISQENHRQALILTPTRELATQIQNTIEKLISKVKTVSSVLLIGGAPMFKQIQNLKKNYNIIVGTPGRITDHLTNKNLNIANVNMLVIDESDRMLDMGFSIQLDEIIKFLPKNKQTLMFSATFSPEVLKLSAKYLLNPQKVTVGATNTAVTQIKQDTKHITNNTIKYDTLSHELDAREGSIIVFVNTKIGVDNLCKKLLKDNHSVAAVHGDTIHRKRERIIKNFRNKKFRIMIATDVASRGLDIPHVAHVVNYDLPMWPEDYIHRIGRTGRAGSEGSALNLVSQSDLSRWKQIKQFISPDKNNTDNALTKKRCNTYHKRSNKKNKSIKPYKRRSYKKR